MKVLRQILCAGFIDQVAVRADLVSKNKPGQRYENTRGVAYKAVGVSDETFIHPSSGMFGGSPPDWIVFSEVVRTSRVWLRSKSSLFLTPPSARCHIEAY
jgi:ATP-dependent RNA helicase DHX37/DHR1